MEKPSATTKKPSDQKENNSTASAMARIRFQLNIATGLHALFDLVNMWLGGVLIGKLLAKASAVNIPSIDTNSLMSPLYRVILLDFLSFEVAAGLATAMVVVSLISRCFELSLASNLATMKGRQLRQKVLQQAVGGNTSNSKSTKKTEKHSAPLESDWAKVASALVHHVSIVEDVCQNEEPQVLYAVLKIAFGFVFTFVVLWEAGVMILAFLILQHGASYLVEKKRAPHLKEVEENRASVHARLLDTIKNSVMIYCTGMAKAEGSAMDELEISRDEERTKSNRLRLLREATGIFTAMVPTAVPIVVWYQLSGVNNPIKALELGTAVLVVILLGCESHKSMIQLDGISDRLRAAKEAEAVINSFLGESPASQTVVDELDKTESMRFTDSDEELAPPSILEESTDGLGTRFVLEGAEQIALRQITLQYASRTDPILNNTTISFEKGKIHGYVLLIRNISNANYTFSHAYKLPSPQIGRRKWFRKEYYHEAGCWSDIPQRRIHYALAKHANRICIPGTKFVRPHHSRECFLRCCQYSNG